MDVSKITELDVYYGDRLVGTLKQLADYKTAFGYSQSWIRDGFSISPFKLPLEPKQFICDKMYSNYMFGVFYDCLPDTWGNRLVDRYVSSLGIDPRKLSLIQRLSLLDSSSLGALSFKPKFNIEIIDEESNNFDILYKKIEKLIKNDEINQIDLISLYHKGSSVGGSRPKVNAYINSDEYIVKFPSKIDKKDIGYEEYSLNELAKKCGLNVNEHILIKSNETKGFFAAKRFDRVNGNRIHIISLAGLFDLEVSLSQIHYLGFLQTVKALCPEDLEEAIGRMIFNYLIDNKDDHPRNFSFMYIEEQHKYRLTPFFDITSTPYLSEHMMLVNDKINPTLDDFIIEAKKVGFPSKKTEEIYCRIKNIIDKRKRK